MTNVELHPVFVSVAEAGPDGEPDEGTNGVGVLFFDFIFRFFFFRFFIIFAVFPSMRRQHLRLGNTELMNGASSSFHASEWLSLQFEHF